MMKMVIFMFFFTTIKKKINQGGHHKMSVDSPQWSFWGRALWATLDLIMSRRHWQRSDGSQGGNGCAAGEQVSPEGGVDPMRSS